jgi:curved DNA-binding protein CbpA
MLRQYCAWLLGPISSATNYAILAGSGQPLVHEFYQVLGVRAEAADEQIKTAFRSLAKQLHPDLHPGDAGTKRRFQEVIRAYETLSDRQSRVAYDAGLKNQRLLKRWQFRANAMTVVAAFSLTVSVGLHWRVLSQAILPAGEHMARLASNESYSATSAEAEGVSSPIQGASPQIAEERGDAAPNKSPGLNAEPSYALLDRSSAKELVDGSLAQPTTAEAPSLQSPALADLVSSDLSLGTANETIAPQSSLPQAPNKAEGGSGAGWWVILGSINVGEADSATTLIEPSVRRASSAAHRCGMGAFNDFSSKFRGFAPGYMVVVIGPFADKADAARSQQQVNRCVTRTYVKYAQHLGERGDVSW